MPNSAPRRVGSVQLVEPFPFSRPREVKHVTPDAETAPLSSAPATLTRPSREVKHVTSDAETAPLVCSRDLTRAFPTKKRRDGLRQKRRASRRARRRRPARRRRRALVTSSPPRPPTSSPPSLASPRRRATPRRARVPSPARARRSDTEPRRTRALVSRGSPRPRRPRTRRTLSPRNPPPPRARDDFRGRWDASMARSSASRARRRIDDEQSRARENPGVSVSSATRSSARARVVDGGGEACVDDERAGWCRVGTNVHARFALAREPVRRRESFASLRRRRVPDGGSTIPTQPRPRRRVWSRASRREPETSETRERDWRLEVSAWSFPRLARGRG